MTSLCNVWWCSNTIACLVPSQGKEKLLERHPLSQKKKLFTSASTLLRLIMNRTKQILRWNRQANELTPPALLKPVKVYWAKWHRLGITGKYSRLHIFLDILAWNVANKLLQFARRSWTPPLHLSSPQRWTGKLKKTLSLLWKISLPSSGIQELKNS